ncbi:hypothetical protein MN608_07570 [Microdochium nivale]|nr:hypothetical protein MN608_07570 [Microdochium nivale]
MPRDVQVEKPSPSAPPAHQLGNARAGEIDVEAAHTPVSATRSPTDQQPNPNNPSPPASASTAVDATISAEFTDGRRPYIFVVPTTRLTKAQFWHLAILNAIYPAFISGAINFTVAYLMYYVSRKKGDEPVRLFKFPHTLAGDAALSILIHGARAYTDDDYCHGSNLEFRSPPNCYEAGQSRAYNRGADLRERLVLRPNMDAAAVQDD